MDYSAVTNAGSNWGISSIFGGHDSRTSIRENSTSKPFSEPIQSMEHGISMIHLREVCKIFSPAQINFVVRVVSQACHLEFSFTILSQPPSVLRPSDTHSDQEAVEISVTKLLLRSYYDIVRKNIEDFVPKAIMHFLVMSLFFSIYFPLPFLSPGSLFLMFLLNLLSTYTCDSESYLYCMGLHMILVKSLGYL